LKDKESDYILNGKGDQFWLTETYEKKRHKALEDRSKFTDAQLELVDVDVDDKSIGGGRTNDDTYEFNQFPFPVDTSIRKREKLDLRDVDPKMGGR